MDGLVGYLADVFAHEHLKFQYVHENEPDDSMFQGATNFQEEMGKITNPDTKSHLYQYQKDLKIRTLRERGDKLKIKQDLQKEKTEEEVREHATRSAVVLASQPKDKGKGVLEGPSSPSFTTMEDTLHKGVELKRNLEKIRSQLQTQEEMNEVQPKR